MPRLLIHLSGQSTRIYELIGDRPISIGRAKSSTLLLDDQSVSRLHAIVRVNPDGTWQIIDRDSSNGVKVNGNAVKEATLRPDDEITLGEYKLRFEDSAARKVVSYGTAKLPSRFEQTLKKRAYTGSFQVVDSLADVAPSEGERAANPAEQARVQDHENKLLKVLNRVNRTLAELKSVGEISLRALDLALEIDGAERGFVMLVDEASLARGNVRNGAYTFEPAALRYRREANAPRPQGAPALAISQSIIRKVMEAGLPLLVSDAQSDPRLATSKSVVAAGIQSAMCAPLGIGDRLRGLLYVDNLSKRGMFSVEDLNAFSVIAVQAGLAMNRVRTRQEAPVPSHSLA
jgi:predicted component of type VI protein secretion system